MQLKGGGEMQDAGGSQGGAATSLGRDKRGPHKQPKPTNQKQAKTMTLQHPPELHSCNTRQCTRVGSDDRVNGMGSHQGPPP